MPRRGYLFNEICFHFHLCVTGIPADECGCCIVRDRDSINRLGKVTLIFDLLTSTGVCPCDGLPSCQFWASWAFLFSSQVEARDRRTHRQIKSNQSKHVSRANQRRIVAETRQSVHVSLQAMSNSSIFKVRLKVLRSLVDRQLMTESSRLKER